MTDTLLLARAVESAVFTCLQNAQRGDADRWFAQADKLERKFKTEHGRHYAAILYPEAA